MTDKYEEFKKWFKDNNYEVAVVTSFERDFKGNCSLDFITVDSENTFKRFENNYQENKDFEKFNEIIKTWLDDTLSTKIYNIDYLYALLKEEDLLK